MLTSADAGVPAQADVMRRYAVDTSVAVPALDAGHAAHRPCRTAVQERNPVLAGHAAFETHSVLTRMPGGLAVSSPDAAMLVSRVFGEVAWLDRGAAADLLAELGPVGIVGGAVHDALVGAAARAHDLVLLTRDRRAVPTYELLGTRVELVGT